MKKLSIIVPVFNVVKYLEECIESLIRQSYSNCEIIVVDDGSSDGSSELCDKLKIRDERIIVIHQRNGGLSAARNSGLRESEGQYISFIDSDDYVDLDMFTSLITELERTESSVAICNFEVFNKANKYKSRRYGNHVIDYAPKTQVEFYAAALDSSCNRVFKADAIKNNNLTFEHKNIVAQEDYWFQVRLFSHINRIVTVEDCFYYYRERGSSITKSHSDGDITNRNLRFYLLTQDYVKQNTDRNISQFLNYLLLNLFSASINNASASSSKVLMDIVSQYDTIPDFFKAISCSNICSIIKGNSLRDKYTRITYWMLRNRLNRIFSAIEAARLKRLRSSRRTDLYYE